MIYFLVLISLLIFLTCFCVLYIAKAMGMSVDFWNDTQYKIWKTIIVLIGGIFLVIIIFINIFAEIKFNDSINKISFILVLSAFFTMNLFIIILNFIAWRGKTKKLKEMIKIIIDENVGQEKSVILQSCISQFRENYIKNQIREYYTKKQIVRAFNKLYKD